jgi:hypothetical protein
VAMGGSKGGGDESGIGKREKVRKTVWSKLIGGAAREFEAVLGARRTTQNAKPKPAAYHWPAVVWAATRPTTKRMLFGFDIDGCSVA